MLARFQKCKPSIRCLLWDCLQQSMCFVVVVVVVVVVVLVFGKGMGGENCRSSTLTSGFFFLKKKSYGLAA